MPVNLLDIEGLNVRYDSVEVLKRISFKVGAGDYVGIVGPNGSGKSTLIKAALGLMETEPGRVRLFGKPLESFSEWRRIGYLPQRLRFFNPNFPATVEEIVGLGLLAGRRLPRKLNKEDRLAVERTMEQMGITALRRRKIGELSGGQQQRVLLGRAIVGGPELLILDEPTTALDVESRERFYSLLKELNREQRVTVILVTHDTSIIGTYASRFLYVDKEIIFDGTFDDFCHSPEMTNLFGEYAQHLICHRH
jgi:zinc transport system ATP-binding protein